MGLFAISLAVLCLGGLLALGVALLVIWMKSGRSQRNC
jgi:hypothetical protein